MVFEELSIYKGQRLSDLLGTIPSNTILNKTLCGIGATTLELTSPRNSIIIEPNVPVIKGKTKRHNGILGVYEGITVQQIRGYLMSDLPYKKILTTPEGFNKVKTAFRHTRYNYFKDFFLLFDECEKIVLDIDYRENVSLPINDFFKFVSKAMVSATPIIPSDPRFEEQNFRIIQIRPQFQYKQGISIQQTNNATLLTKYILETRKDTSPICIFYCSVKGITSIIEQMGIKEDTSIFCGIDNADKLRGEGFKNVFDEIQVNEHGAAQLSHYNFFTSRFYSAVDIITPEKPLVLMVTNVYSASHTMIDPSTEAIQILGRFRNGVSDCIHITNYNRHLEYREKEAMNEYLNSQHEVYKELFIKCTAAQGEGEKDILNQAMTAVEYSRFVDDDCNKKYFMYDNRFAEEHLKGIYQKKFSIAKAYKETGAFEVTYRYIPLSVSGKDCSKLNDRRKSRTEINKLAYRILKKIKKQRDEYDTYIYKEFKNCFSLICDAFDILGENKIEEIGFSEKALRTAIQKKQIHNGELHQGVVNAIHQQFNEDRWYSTTEINSVIEKIYKTFNLPTKTKGQSNKIALYFEAVEHNTRIARGWKLGKRKIP